LGALKGRGFSRALSKYEFFAACLAPASPDFSQAVIRRRV
jgi:hypothetical protein